MVNVALEVGSQIKIDWFAEEREIESRNIDAGGSEFRSL